MMIRYIIAFFLLVLSTSGHSQLSIIVTKIPENTPLEDAIYIAGNFNGWNPGNSNFILQKDSNNTYRITLQPQPGTVRFKFTRGSWAKVEGNSSGGFIPDRTESYNGQPKTIELTIAGWEDIGGNNNTSTAGPGVSVLSSAFYMPQLNRSRKIWLYLPPDYHSTSKRYPVLYMHDGQNLFDRLTSFSGEWKVDESLDSLHQTGDYGCIVVGIENGGTQRINEYSPWVNPQYGGGQGEPYLRFIVETLKTYIDSTFRTLSDAENTGIMGSSMGGLISVYGGIARPDVFGKIGAFSSSFWFSPKSYTQVSETGVGENTYVYMIAGAMEGGNQVSDMEKMAELLVEKGLGEDKLYNKSHPDGAHSEWYWAREFPAAYKWLFEKKTSETGEIRQNCNFELFLNFPSLYIYNNIGHEKFTAEVFDLSGIRVFHAKDTSTHFEIDLSHSGLYYLKVSDSNGYFKWKKFVLLK